MPDRYLIGCGCPRSGTTALARLLDAQSGVAVSHEDNPVVPWQPDTGDVERSVGWLERGGHFLGSAARPVMGDVSFSWLPALEACQRHFGDQLRVVVLRRDKEEWLASVTEAIGDAVLHDDTTFATQFPTYDEPLEDAWSRYYDTYYANVDEDLIVPTEALGGDEGQQDILERTNLSPTTD